MLVTGGTRGIGKAIAFAFAKKGARVAVLFRSDQVSADKTLAELEGNTHLAIKADVADADQVKTALDDVVESFGRLDIVVNNAGIGVYHPLPTTNYKDWQQAWKKVQVTQSKDEYVSSTYRVKPDSLVIETKHYTWVSDAQTPYKNLWWMRPDEPEKQNAFRKGSLEYAENMWTHIEATGSSMPYWRLPKPWKKYNILIRLAIDGGYAGGGFGACDLRDATGGPRNEGLGHEWYHGHPHGGWSTLFFGESVCHGGRHLNLPGETPMFSPNFCYPWRNVSSTQYQCPLWYFATSRTGAMASCRLPVAWRRSRNPLRTTPSLDSASNEAFGKTASRVSAISLVNTRRVW